ncbi:MAG: hypothetical protein GY906_06410 [bacterium]|nr:hypothetical protein [bacterium]
MGQVHAEWKVLSHRPIERLEDNLWVVKGTLPGMGLKRVMTLVRLDDGRIVLHSVIALDDAAMAEIEAWGTPAIMLIPNAYHRLDAPAYLARYPDLKVFCPKGSLRKTEDVIHVDGDYDEVEGGEMLNITHLEGVRKAEGVMIVRSEAGTTLVFNDAIFNMSHGRGVSGFVFRYVTGSTGGPRVTRLFRWLAVKDKAAFREHLKTLAATPNLKRIVVSHHRAITERPGEVLRELAEKL